MGRLFGSVILRGVGGVSAGALRGIIEGLTKKLAIVESLQGEDVGMIWGLYPPASSALQFTEQFLAQTRTDSWIPDLQ